MYIYMYVYMYMDMDMDMDMYARIHMYIYIYVCFGVLLHSFAWPFSYPCHWPALTLKWPRQAVGF